jgi:hypothetical protein
VPLGTPYPFVTASGHLLIEVEGADPANVQDLWFSDAETGFFSVNVTPGGCHGRSNEQVQLTTFIMGVGGMLRSTVLHFGDFTLFLNWVGIGNRSWGGVPLPMDLTALGATKCALGTDVVALQAAAGPLPTFTWPIPNDPVLADAVFFTQGAGVLAGINPAGLLTTNTRQLRIDGATPPRPLVQLVFRRSDLGNPVGNMTAIPVGTVIRFEGTFH